MQPNPDLDILQDTTTDPADTQDRTPDIDPEIEQKAKEDAQNKEEHIDKLLLDLVKKSMLDLGLKDYLMKYKKTNLHIYRGCSSAISHMIRLWASSPEKLDCEVSRSSQALQLTSTLARLRKDGGCLV
jgi:hypothetical protein